MQPNLHHSNQQPTTAGTKLFLKTTVQSLLAIKHVPPAHGNEGIISPVAGSLVAQNLCSDNIQFPTGYTFSRYLTKYIVPVDNYNIIKVKPPNSDSDSNAFHVQGEKTFKHQNNMKQNCPKRFHWFKTQSQNYTRQSSQCC